MHFSDIWLFSEVTDSLVTELEPETKTSSSVLNLFFSTTPINYSIIPHFTNEVTVRFS